MNTEDNKEQIKNEIKEFVNETSMYHYNQSSKASDLIRKIVFAIIGSSWALVFVGNESTVNVFLKLTIATSFIFLLLDVLHYFLDSCTYFHYSWDIYKSQSMEYVQNVYLPRRERLDRRSFGLFCAKIAIGFIVAIVFILGIFFEQLLVS